MVYKYEVEYVGYGGFYNRYPGKFTFTSNYDIDEDPEKVQEQAHNKALDKGFRSNGHVKIKSINKVEAKKMKVKAFDTVEEYTNYLSNTLIPDLKESGSDAMAEDFIDLLWYLEAMSPDVENFVPEEDFIFYLETTLIPDLKESGSDAMAEDLETGIGFLRQKAKASKVEADASEIYNVIDELVDKFEADEITGDALYNALVQLKMNWIDILTALEKRIGIKASVKSKYKKQMEEKNEEEIKNALKEMKEKLATCELDGELYKEKIKVLEKLLTPEDVKEVDDEVEEKVEKKEEEIKKEVKEVKSNMKIKAGMFTWRTSDTDKVMVAPFIAKEFGGVENIPYDYEAITKATVLLPNGSKYTGTYNGYGEIGGVDVFAALVADLEGIKLTKKNQEELRNKFFKDYDYYRDVEKIKFVEDSSLNYDDVGPSPDDVSQGFMFDAESDEDEDDYEYDDIAEE